MRNRLEFFNEIMIDITSVHLIFFTDWVNNDLEKFMIGWSMIGWMFCLFIFNIMFVAYFAYHHFRLVYIKYKQIINKYLES